MRIAQGGVYVMVQKFGIEGLLTVDHTLTKAGVQVTTNVEREEAMIAQMNEGKREERVIKVFDNVKVEIRAEMVEFRRTVSLNLLID